MTERYRACSLTAGSINGPDVWGLLWCDSNTIWRPTVCINTVDQTPAGPGYPACNMFQVQPRMLGGCDSTRAQSPHPQGILTVLGDGSARFVSGGISPATWAAACDPRDGQPMPADW